jgi:hypothetical protein
MTAGNKSCVCKILVFHKLKKVFFKAGVLKIAQMLLMLKALTYLSS